MDEDGVGGFYFVSIQYEQNEVCYMVINHLFCLWSLVALARTI